MTKMNPKHHPNLFKNRYPKLKGRDWIKKIDPEDKQVFISIGMTHNQHGKLGGKHRAKNGLRDKRGRFIAMKSQ